MPELPEVETVRRQLAGEIVGEEIAGVEVRREKCFLGDKEGAIEEKIAGVRRVGKYLFIGFESGRGLTIHLKMTGRLVIGQSENSERQNTRIIREPDLDYEKTLHTRVVLRMKSGRSLYFWDMRTFGYVRVEEEIKQAEKWVGEKLGPEPWEMRENEFMRIMKKTRRKVKEVILDQRVLAGVGNIYANDALHLAGIDPRRTANSLQHTEVKNLLVAVRQVMERGLAAGGASDNSYLDAYGEKGAYQNEFVVYGKTKGKCPKCGKELRYGKVGGRGTWWCTKCQR